MCLRRTTLSVLGVLCVVSGGVTPPRAFSNEFALLVGSQGTGSIPRYDGTTGATVNFFVPPGGGGLGSVCAEAPMGLLFGPDGNLYVASGGETDKVLRYNGQTGEFMDTFVADGSGGLDQPASLAFGSDGHLYVSSTATDSILRYDGQTGAFIDAFVASGIGGLDEPYGLLFGPDGNLYVCSSVMVEADVLRYDGQTGAFIDVFALGADFGLFENVALEFGPDGNLYVTSAHPGKVVRYDGQTGASIGEFVTPGSGGLEDPTSLRFGPDGDLYLSEYAGDSVLRYDGQTGAPLPGPLGAVGTAEFVPAGAAGLDCPWDLVFAKLPPPVCQSSNSPVLETLTKSGEPLNRKNRYISVSLTDVGRTQAIRVVLGAKDAGRGNIPPPFEIWKGQVFYAGEPRAFCENAGQGWTVGPNPDVPGVSAAPCAPVFGIYENGQDYFWAALLVCDSALAHFMDWTTLANHCNTMSAAGLDGYPCTTDADCQNAGNPNGTCGVSDVVHLFHEGVVPSHLVAGAGPIDYEAVYAISAIDSSCPLDFEGGYSIPAQLHQAGWGDVVLSVADCPNWPPEESVGVVTDVVAQLNKFSNLPCAVQKTRVDLVPCRVDFNIGIPDVVASLDAFGGGDYEDVCGSGQCSAIGLCKGGPDHGTACTNDNDCSDDICHGKLEVAGK